MTVSDNISKIKEKIACVCLKSKRDKDSITIVAVSKGRATDRIRESAQAGIVDIGENRVQEAMLKYNSSQLINHGSQLIRWHMIGHLQTNKAKDAVKIFDLIQSVDSLRLAMEIDKQAFRIGKIQDVLIEVKTSCEESKTGLKADDLIEVIKKIATLNNINIQGLMTMAPLSGDPEETRPNFKALRELKERINESRITNRQLQILSMGMSDDFQVAIEEGSNMVRLGRAIFEI